MEKSAAGASCDAEAPIFRPESGFSASRPLRQRNLPADAPPGRLWMRQKRFAAFLPMVLSWQTAHYPV